MKKILILIVALSISTIAMAQKITGLVVDDAGKPLDKTTVSLLAAKDSQLVKIFVTSIDGKYNFSVPTGSYFIQTSHIGHNSTMSSIISNENDIIVPTTTAAKLQAKLETVVVTAKKPMIEVKADKTVLNIEGTINATGSNAMELLRKAPGVLVDKDDNLSLAGKNGVQVYIDGKPSPIAGADLAAYLKTVQAEQVESIELITNPSAKYEAAGNAGIINIKLKKNKMFGTNGSVNLGYNVGIFGKYNAGLALNHRTKNFNVFGNYNLNHGLNRNNFNLERTQLDTLFDQAAVMQNLNTTNGYKAGIDYFISEKSTLGFLMNGNFTNSDATNFGVTDIIYNPTGIKSRILKSNNETKSTRNNNNFNINFRNVKKSGRELNIDADYGIYTIRTNQLQPNVYWNGTNTVKLSETNYRFISPTNIKIASLKADYEQPFKKGKLGYGLKIAQVNTDNNFGRFDVVSGTETLDISRSNQFDYSENINAGYLNYNRAFKGFMIQAGLRVENTNLTGKSYPVDANSNPITPSNNGFDRAYTNLFPSAAFTYNKNPMNQWGLSYSRRIDRPAYQDLNPFEMKLDEYTFQKGNINLRPQYSNVFALTNTYKYKLTTSLSYSHVADVFTQLIDTTEKSKSFISKQNLATQDIIALNVSYPFSYKSYSAFANLSANYSLYKADFSKNGTGSRVINLDVTTFNIYMQHSIKFGEKKDWTAEVSGWYNSPSIWQGTFESKEMWTVDAGLQKNILKGKGSFKLSVTDIFFSMRWRGESNFAGQNTIAFGNWESRQLRTAFTYRFGNSKVKAARQRKSSSEDEQKRTNGGGGGIGQ